MIDITKKYRTRDGREVRILATDIKNKRSVVAVITGNDGKEYCVSLHEDGKHWSDADHDLIEVGPYDDFKIDEPVVATLFPTIREGFKRYFAGTTEDGRPMVFDDGRTAWSSAGSRTICFSVRRPTEEDLK